MKRIIIASIALTSFLFVIAAISQNAVEHPMKEHLMEMMQDEEMVKMVMDHIASNPEMRMQMMHRMMHGEEGEMHAMMEKCKKMMQGDHEHMHGMMDGNGHHQMSCCAKSEDKKEENGHERHH